MDDERTTPRDGAYDDFGDGTHISDEELRAAMADFEQQFAHDEAGSDAGSDAGAGSAADAPDGGDASGAEAVLDFDDELQGLLGNRAKVAAIITRLASAELLAAFCQLSDVSATCLEHSDGAVAVLRNLDGDGPEAAVRDLTTVVSGMPAILAVNRADKLEATLYIKGEPGQTFAPPILFTVTPPFVEDLMLGIADVPALVGQGVRAVESGDLDREAAMKVIARHTRFGGRGGSSIR